MALVARLLTMEPNDIKELLKEAIQESTHFQTHELHHEWIQMRIDNEKARNAMCTEITKSVLQWSAVGIIGYLVLWVKEHFTL